MALFNYDGEKTIVVIFISSFIFAKWKSSFNKSSRLIRANKSMGKGCKSYLYIDNRIFHERLGHKINCFLFCFFSFFFIFVCFVLLLLLLFCCFWNKVVILFSLEWKNLKQFYQYNTNGHEKILNYNRLRLKTEKWDLKSETCLGILD